MKMRMRPHQTLIVLTVHVEEEDKVVVVSVEEGVVVEEEIIILVMLQGGIIKPRVVLFLPMTGLH